MPTKPVTKKAAPAKKSAPAKQAAPAKKTAPAKAKAVAVKTKTSQAKIKTTGQNTRVKGHLSASTRRAQGKRDSKN